MEQKLSIIMAAMLPFETLVKRLQQAINNYNQDDSPDNKEHVAAIASMVLMNYMSNGSLDGAIKISERFDQLDNIEKLFHIENN